MGVSLIALVAFWAGDAGCLSDVARMGPIGVRPAKAGLVAEEFDQGRAQEIELGLDAVQVALHRDDVVVTPHVASATDKGRVRMYAGAIANARTVLDGARPVDVVNPHVYDVLEKHS